MSKFGYFIDLDERGSFRADVRDASGKTVFEIAAGDELPEGESSVFEDGFMRDKHDLAGLQAHLVNLGVLGDSDQLLPMAEFESQLEDEARATARP